MRILYTMNQAPHPSHVTVDRPNNLLIVDWQDGAHCEYPLAGLRFICPCVQCRGGHEYMGLPIDPADLQSSPAPGVSTEVVGAHFVGDYAIQFVWADGHDSGIYGWTLLRPLCPQAQLNPTNMNPTTSPD
ncbi:MAG: DUF971 domain-containing protein [Proteobacteria bacterium]|nr:DUF971 domain-containing protein [Pseudomonadota bacterium]